MQLRAYQQRAIADLRENIRAGRRRLVLVAPTGSGKTVVAAEIVSSAVERGAHVVFIAPRREIIDQTVEKLGRFGVPAGVIMADDERFDPTQATQVCTIQTLARRLDRLPPGTLVIVDECHHAASDSFRKVLAGYPEAVILGLTATPWRTDRLGLADFFEGHVVAATPAELIASGDLVPYDCFAYDAPDLHKVPIVAGDYQQKALEMACNTQVLVGSVVREYLEHGGNRRALCFPVSIAHSQALVAEFKAAGVEADHLDCKTKRDERRAILARLKSGEVRVVASVGVLVEGFDEPAAEVAILARPTKSLALHLQMIGRVLRPSPGKERALLHDHGGNTLRLGLPDDEREYSLMRTPKRVRELHTCSLCHAVFAALKQGCCPRCGELIAPPPEEQLEPVQPRKPTKVVTGERIDLAEIRRRRSEAGLRRDLSDRDIERVASASKWTRMAEYKRLVNLAIAGGWGPTWPRNKYRETFGDFPPPWTQEELRAVAAARFPFLPLERKRRSA